MEASVPSAAWIALAAVASLLAIFQTCRLMWSRVARTWKIRARARRAVAGEHRAEPMLRRAGYEVVERQARGSWTVYADGAPLEVGLRADLLVTRDGRSYVAEVKTGRLAPRLDHAPTRRQLLEYRAAFDVDGVLLVDAESERVTLVELGERDLAPGDAGRAAVGGVGVPVFAAGVAVGIVVGWLLHV